MLDGLARIEHGAARERLVRSVLAERRGKAHLLRILDAHGHELGYEAPLRHALRVEAAPLAEPMHRFAAAQLAGAFRGAFDEGLAVVARFLHALSYALAVDAPEHLEEDAIAARVSSALAGLELTPPTPGKLAGVLHASWQAGGGVAFADAAARARRIRETRSALVSSGEIPAGGPGADGVRGGRRRRGGGRAPRRSAETALAAARVPGRAAPARGVPPARALTPRSRRDATVPGAGFEPASPTGQVILSHPRLPIPPPGRRRREARASLLPAPRSGYSIWSWSRERTASIASSSSSASRSSSVVR